MATLISPEWPIYAAGIEQDDELQAVDGQKIGSETDLATALARRKPGDRATIAFVNRAGATKSASVMLAEDPHVEVVPEESAKGSLTPVHQQFRDHWLSRARSVHARPITILLLGVPGTLGDRRVPRPAMLLESQHIRR